MIEEELKDLIEKIQRRGCEWQTMEVKSAQRGCPERLYDTLSAFSNQDEGGILIFGLDERRDFAKVGVYDAHALQKKVMEYCEQMEPVVRPVFTVYDEEGKTYVAAEIPALDLADRPCFKKGKGRLQGAYIRVGEADKPMTEYEVYSYEAYRKKYRDDIRPAEGASMQVLDQNQLDVYQARVRSERPNLARLTEEEQYELNGVTKQGHVTMSALLLFGLFPQSYYPRLCISATRVPGQEIGELDLFGKRFTDTKRIEGTIQEMLDKALDFVRNNMRTSTGIDSLTGKRTDVPQYPMVAVREAVLNALVHRDYSVYTQTKPILLNMYEDRLEVTNPGGLYGRLTVNQLGYTQPDTRNPVLVTALEILGKTENRYSGIPTIRHAMEQWRLPAPVFISAPGEFKVVLYNTPLQAEGNTSSTPENNTEEKDLLTYCRSPRTRTEIMAYLKVSSWQYVFQRYVSPLVKAGSLRMTIPESPRSRNQMYVTGDRFL